VFLESSRLNCPLQVSTVFINNYCCILKHSNKWLLYGLFLMLSGRPKYYTGFKVRVRNDKTIIRMCLSKMGGVRGGCKCVISTLQFVLFLRHSMIKPQLMGSMYLRDQVAYQTVVEYRVRKRSARTVTKVNFWRRNFLLDFSTPCI
jgi:hypothetical protein